MLRSLLEMQIAFGHCLALNFSLVGQTPLLYGLVGMFGQLLFKAEIQIPRPSSTKLTAGAVTDGYLC